MYVLAAFHHWLIDTAAAQQTPISDYCGQLHPGCGAGKFFIIQLANRAIDLISTVIGAAAVVMIIWGAIRIITSGGNDEGKTQGRQIIINALIGLALAVLAKVIVYFVADFIATYSELPV